MWKRVKKKDKISTLYQTTNFRMTQIQLFWSYWGLMPLSLNGVLHRFYQYFSHITATIHIIHAFLGFTSTKLGSEVSCPRTLTRKNPEDPVRLEPMNPGLRVKHFTTEPRGTLMTLSTVKVISWQSVTHMCFLAFSQLFFPKPPSTFLTCFCRGERRKYARKKTCLNRGSNSQPPGHESYTLTTEPPRGVIQIQIICRR